MSRGPSPFVLGGGLDLVSPMLSMAEGRVIGGLNYEPAPVGYRRAAGFERFDGRPEPHRQETEQEIEAARALIEAVPGGGPVRGAVWFGGKAYAFRDVADRSSCKMYASTSAGWAEVNLGWMISFEGGTAEIVENKTLTGDTSEATATVKRVIVQSGDWTTNDAAGYLILHDVDGAFEDGEDLTTDDGAATANGVDVAIRLLPGGRFKFKAYNFSGARDRMCLYGADGVNRGFEFDGQVFVPINTGLPEAVSAETSYRITEGGDLRVTDDGSPRITSAAEDVDAPKDLNAHSNHLFLFFRGGSAQHSGVGDPYAWSPVVGAGEIAVGDEISGSLVHAGALILYSKNRIDALYGTSAADWVLKTVSDEAGACENTIQKVSPRVVHFDWRGIADLIATSAFGDFASRAVSAAVEPWFKWKSGRGTQPVVSVVKDNQYLLFFSDGDVMLMDWSKKNPEFMVQNYGKAVFCASAAEEGGVEYVLLGGDDGFVYRLGVGDSFDGAEINHYLRLPFNHLGRPGFDKQFFGVELEVDAPIGTELMATAEFSYGGHLNRPQLDTPSDMIVGSNSGGFWGEDNWSGFYWGERVVGVAKADIRGKGENISLSIAGASANVPAHTIKSVTFDSSQRGRSRQ